MLTIIIYYLLIAFGMLTIITTLHALGYQWFRTFPYALGVSFGWPVTISYGFWNIVITKVLCPIGEAVNKWWQKPRVIKGGNL